jgi:hypothetical protein
MPGPTIQIIAPVREDREGGIRPVATFRQNDRLGVAEAVVFQSDACTFPTIEENRCYAEAPVPDKTFDGIEVDDAIGAPFTMYAGVMCYANPDPDEKQRARDILARGQDRELETLLAAWADGGTVLTAGANVAEAIGRVDQALDGGYIGRGVILMSRYDAVLADAAGAISIKGLDDFPTTVNGTPVIASGGIAPGSVRGVGAVLVEHSSSTDREVLDPRMNRNYALSEQVFVLAVDCEFRVTSTITTP